MKPAASSVARIMKAIWERATTLVGCALALILLTSTLTKAQTQPPAADQASLPKPAPASITQLPPSSDRWALVIGVSIYDDPNLNPLYGSNDAQTIAADLTTDAGFPKDQVFLLTDDQPPDHKPTRERILFWLSSLKQNASPNALILVAFSGHGLESGGKSFLMARDTHLNFDAVYLTQNAVDIETDITHSLRDSMAKQIIVFIDACRNNPYAAAGSEQNPLTGSFADAFDYTKQNIGKQAYATIFATSLGGEAYQYQDKKMGYFSWVLDQAFSGEAYDVTGNLTLSGLIDYLQDRTPQLVRINNPGETQVPYAVVGGYQADHLVLAHSKAPKPSVPAASLQPVPAPSPVEAQSAGVSALIKTGDDALSEGLPAKAADAYTRAWRGGRSNSALALKAAGLWLDRVGDPVQAASILQFLVAHPTDATTNKTVSDMVAQVAPSLLRLYKQKRNDGEIALGSSPLRSTVDAITPLARAVDAEEAMDSLHLELPDSTDRYSLHVELARANMRMCAVDITVSCSEYDKALVELQNAVKYGAQSQNILNNSNRELFPLMITDKFFTFLQDAFGDAVATDSTIDLVNLRRNLPVFEGAFLKLIFLLDGDQTSTPGGCTAEQAVICSLIRASARRSDVCVLQFEEIAVPNFQISESPAGPVPTGTVTVNFREHVFRATVGPSSIFDPNSGYEVVNQYDLMALYFFDEQRAQTAANLLNSISGACRPFSN
jgi:uncharacterized caspase-like protein